MLKPTLYQGRGKIAAGSDVQELLRLGIIKPARVFGCPSEAQGAILLRNKSLR
jgi:hypothetical protein